MLVYNVKRNISFEKAVDDIHYISTVDTLISSEPLFRCLTSWAKINVEYLALTRERVIVDLNKVEHVAYSGGTLCETDEDAHDFNSLPFDFQAALLLNAVSEVAADQMDDDVCIEQDVDRYISQFDTDTQDHFFNKEAFLVRHQDNDDLEECDPIILDNYMEHLNKMSKLSHV